MPINTVEDLREHLLLAIEVELSLVPVYLYTMYSIEDQSSEAALLIRSVVVEEMLHACLDTNILLAIGGEPRFTSMDIMPSYPGPMRHHIPPLILHLERCSVDFVRDTMMLIERPEAPGAPPEDDDYETQGQFYMAIEQALRRLDGRSDLFADPHTSRQLTDPSFYGPVTYDDPDSGGLMAVENLESAIAAVEIVIHQGEGVTDERWADPAHQALTHYYKFLQIADGDSPIGRVRPAPRDPKTADFPAGLQPVSDLFNALYRYSYLTLDELFKPVDDKGDLVGKLYQLMSNAMGPVATYLMEQPGAGPTFEIYDMGSDPGGTVRALADQVAQSHPGLSDVEEAVSGF